MGARCLLQFWKNVLFFDYEYYRTFERLVTNILGSVYPSRGDEFMSFHWDVCDFLPPIPIV